MLREYQQRDIDNIREAVRAGNRSVCYVLPTGGGKSKVATQLASCAQAKGKRVLFMAPRRELVYQISEHFGAQDVDHGVLMAGEPSSFMESNQIACIPTLYRRCFEDGEPIHPTIFGRGTPVPGADLVIVDEAHLGVGGRSQQVIDHYKSTGATVVGLTATPARTDGRGLGEIYDEMVQGPNVSELTEQGYLVPARYFAGEKPNLEGIKTQAGDYNKKQLGERADKVKLVGDVVSNWARLASDRQTFVFAVNVAHSRHLCERFQSIGVKAEHIDGTLDNEERKAIHDRLQSGETQVVTNCLIYTYGVDYPPLSCIVLAAPTKSITKYLQMVGRGLRTCEGKSDCLVLDHAGAIDEVGFADDIQPWSLDGKEKIQDRKQAAEYKQPDNITCDDCGAAFRPAKYCPGCGADMTSRSKKAIEAHEAELVEIKKKEKKRHRREWSMDDKIKFFGELRAYARNKGYNPGWAAHTYRARVGTWPNDPRIKKAGLIPPSSETLAWIQHMNIRRAKAKEKEKKAA